MSFGFLRWNPGRSIGFTVALVALLWMVSTAAAAPLNKPFTVTFGTPVGTPPPPGVTIPGGMPAGVTIPSFTLTLRNDTGTQQLGSANILVPETFRIASTPTTDRGVLLPPSGNLLQLRNAALPPGAAVTITLTLGVPCTTQDPTTYHWIVSPKQSNDFKGTGNDLTQPPPATLDNKVIGRCALRFAADGQPKKAVKNQAIRAVDFAPPSSPAVVAVEAIDGRSAGLAQRLIGVVPEPAITVSQGTPATVRLVPSSTTKTAVAGVAGFPDLSMTAAGTYTLRATTTDTRFATSASSPASSASFTVVDVRADCNAAGCQAALGPATAPTTTITGAAGTATGFIELSENLGAEPNCKPDFGYTPPTGSAWYEFNFTATRAKTIAINYTSAQMKTVANKGALEICFAAPTEFVGKSGTVAFDYNGAEPGTQGFLGLLPDCPRVPAALCVLGRNPLPGGGASISFFAPSGLGDPRYH